MIRLKTKIMAAIVLMLASISLTLGGIEAFADDQIPSNQTSESTAPENTSADTVGGTENLENNLFSTGALIKCFAYYRPSAGAGAVFTNLGTLYYFSAIKLLYSFL